MFSGKVSLMFVPDKHMEFYLKKSQFVLISVTRDPCILTPGKELGGNKKDREMGLHPCPPFRCNTCVIQTLVSTMQTSTFSTICGHFLPCFIWNPLEKVSEYRHRSPWVRRDFHNFQLPTQKVCYGIRTSCSAIDPNSKSVNRESNCQTMLTMFKCHTDLRNYKGLLVDLERI